MAWTERYVDASASGGGTGTSPSDPWTFAEAVSNSAAGMRVNFKAGLYANTTGVNTSFNGTSSSPIWWRGYKTTVGDLDSKFTGDKVNGTDIPEFRWTSNYIVVDASHLHFSGLCFTSTVSNRPAIYDRRSHGFAKNCRFSHIGTSSSNNYLALDAAGGRRSYLNCEFSANAGSVEKSLAATSDRTNFFNCLFRGLQSTPSNVGAVSSNISTFDSCIFYNMTKGLSSSDYMSVKNCLFSGISGDAITVNYHYDRSGTAFVSNYFHNIGGWCIANSSGTSDATQLIANNVFHNSPNKFQDIADGPEFDAIADASDEFVDSASGDFTLKSTSNGYGAGLGGFWSLPTTDHGDIGAVQHFPIADSSQPQEAGTQVLPFGQWAVTKPEAQLHPLRSS